MNLNTYLLNKFNIEDDEISNLNGYSLIPLLEIFCKKFTLLKFVEDDFNLLRGATEINFNNYDIKSSFNIFAWDRALPYGCNDITIVINGDYKMDTLRSLTDLETIDNFYEFILKSNCLKEEVI